MSTTVKDVIDRTRESVLDDTDPQAYLWSNPELVNLLNRAYNDLFVDLLPVKDQTTEAIVEIKLLSNVGVYSLDSRIIQVTHGRLQDDYTFGPLVKDTEKNLNETVSDWRNETGTPRRYIPQYSTGYLSTYPKFDDTNEVVGDSDISFTALTKTISQPGGDLSPYAVGDSIYISGTTDNNGYFTVATAGTTSFTVSETVTDESNTSATIRKVEDTLLMTVNRLATARFSTTDITDETAITEIPEDFLDGLPDGIGQYAFMKPDTYTYYPQKADRHKLEFKEFKKYVRRRMILLNKPERTRKIRSGTGLGY